VLAWLLLCGGTTARTLEFTTTQVTDADVAVSPDGKELVFPILGHLFRMPVTGGTAVQLTFGASYENSPALSPDGRRVAFVSDRDGSGGNVFVLELATGKIRQVTHETQAGHPTWTPDGKAMFYLRYLPREDDPRPASMFTRLALCDLRKIASGGDRNTKPEIVRGPGLLRSLFYLAGGQPAWTVVEQEAGGGFTARSTTHVETATPNDGKVKRLRTLPGDLGHVAGSPGGDGIFIRTPEVQFLRLADGVAPRVTGVPGGGSASRFAVTADGKTAYLSERGQLVKVALGSGARAGVTFRAAVKLEVAEPVRPKWAPPAVGVAVQPRAVLRPQLSPGGRSLTFAAAGHIWQQFLDGGSAHRLLQGETWETEPALSPDGRHLAFLRDQFGQRGVFVVDLESGYTHVLADLGGDARARFLNWSRDGRRLVFQRSEGLQSPLGLISVNVTNGRVQRLATAASDWSIRPHFTPEGDAVYFTSRIGGPGALHRLSLKQNAKPEAMTHLRRHVNEARVSHDGKWLAFRRNTEIWVAPLGAEPVEEEEVRRLSPEGGPTFGFTWDSAAVVYAVGNRVWRHPLDGGNREELPVRLDWRSATPPPLLVRRVRVLDLGAGEFGEETSLLIENGAIRWIGAERQRDLPEGVITVDAAGRRAIPGLFDFHVHSAWANHEAEPDTFLAYGVTSVRDTGGGLETLSARADRGTITGDPVPRYFYSGEIFEGAKPMWGDAFLQLYTATEAREHVQRWKERGAHFIKVYPSLPWPLQREVAEEARRQGLPVVGHGLGLEEIVKSVTLGYACLEHCPMSLNEDVQRMLVAAGTRCDPTLAILGGHSNLLRREPKRLADPKLRVYFSESFIRAARGGGLPGMSGRFVDLGAARRAGIKIHAGTDALMVGTFFGASLHWELEHLVEAGLKPLDVLRMATEEAAAAVGAGEYLGTLAPGKLGDLVLLDADPLENIRNTQAIWRVVKGGWVFDPSALRAPAHASTGN
jgi:imidazolonepropionase-like amidohydrolase/Tol biopolymer transport system component